jgi:thiamine kinase-like enzyme
MLPHKWIRSGKELLKVDSVTHGDDHFFPGPTDIAWDLAGTIVEWNLTSEQKSSLLTRYHSLTGDCVEQRIMPYLLAYTVFRMAYSKMAAASMRGSEEEVRLIRDFRRYRDLTQSYMKRSFPAAASVG